jgi:hypothetical protein
MARRVLATLLALALATPSVVLPQATGTADLEKGIRLTREGDFDAAVAALQSAIKQLGAPAAAKDLARAYTYLGVAHLNMGQDAAARADFQAALKADPKLTLSSSEFPPKVTQAFASARSAAGLPAATGPSIDHSPLKCLEENLFPEVRAAVQSPANVQKSRVYFKAHQFPDWYYVEMATDQVPNYLGTLPKPLQGTAKVDYYVYALDGQLQTTQTSEYDPDVTKTCRRDAAAGKPKEPAITLYGTKEGQAAIPPGFDKAGIVAFVTVAGAMVAGAALAGGSAAAAGAAGAGSAASAAGAGAGAAGGGMSGTTIALIAGGVAAAGLGVAAAAGGGGEEDPRAVDNDGDGASENAGDCNDANPNVRPGGTVGFTVQPAFTGNVACNAQATQPQTYTVANNSCNTVTVNSLSFTTRRINGNCSTNNEPRNLPLAATSVAPGATTVVRTGPANGNPGLCCPSRNCNPGLCNVEFSFALSTSAGSFTANASYTINYPRPNSCPASCTNFAFVRAPEAMGDDPWCFAPPN